MCSPLARARPKLHLSFVVEIESVEGQLVQQTQRARGNSEAPAAFGPAIAEIGILVDAGFVQLDQQMAVVLGACQQIANLLEIGLPALRVGPTEQLSGLLSGKLQAMLGGAAGMVSRQQVRPNRLRTQPTRRRSAQRGEHLKLRGGVGDVILSAQHVGDAHGDIVDHARQHVEP